MNTRGGALWTSLAYRRLQVMDRSEISRALAKAIAYKNCNKDKKAEEWAIELIRLLECENILKTEDNRESF